ncbi:hypothetical protein FBY51_1864 [Zymomonas mobilis]|uniref:helix-turn-helix domain-containing protein n=3 Tax=Zymomonas mobilis TaxID=542 RepID=UPI00026D82CA|nr:helix-turn-helix domain-containing protein [Zymomonas mobilis]AFN57615.1 hypothetical protein ZZ6_1764 [Zymomonas mobilis subsp. mobilis ATCC 29191]TQL14605.1 hypothetical protein FBY51_1864 [Zymomonas mobilis]
MTKNMYNFLRQLQSQGMEGATAEKIAFETYHEQSLPLFDEEDYCDQLISRDLDLESAADIARKTAKALSRDPLERAEIRLKPLDPVHRNSYEVGEREHLVWKAINKEHIGAYLEAVDQYSIKTRALSDKAVRLLKMLFRMADFRTGRLEPTIETISNKVGYARATVVRLLTQLKEQGFLRWIRRSIKIKKEGERPRRRQTSNAYGFLSPASWPEIAKQAFLRVMQRRQIPLPDDFSHAKETDAATTEEMIESSPVSEWTQAIFAKKRSSNQKEEDNKSDLAETLASLGEAIEREEKRSETPPNRPLKKPQNSGFFREFNFEHLYSYNYSNNTDIANLNPKKEDSDCLASASAGSADVLFNLKTETDRFTTELHSLNLRSDQVSAILQHRKKRIEHHMMPLSPNEIADLLIKTRQMKP